MINERKLITLHGTLCWSGWDLTTLVSICACSRMREPGPDFHQDQKTRDKSHQVQWPYVIVCVLIFCLFFFSPLSPWARVAFKQITFRVIHIQATVQTQGYNNISCACICASDGLDNLSLEVLSCLDTNCGSYIKPLVPTLCNPPHNSNAHTGKWTSNLWQHKLIGGNK